ncbi:Formin-like protein [Labeo rohita]|uniref:Formin-like protein n=1 Tax=Labeo rohita TaxID=84645 RepID=A0ABQ8LID2_LABRO|nr:Formin-like protein [Labeo rohita]
MHSLAPQSRLHWFLSATQLTLTSEASIPPRPFNPLAPSSLVSTVAFIPSPTGSLILPAPPWSVVNPPLLQDFTPPASPRPSSLDIPF